MTTETEAIEARAIEAEAIAPGPAAQAAPEAGTGTGTGTVVAQAMGTRPLLASPRQRAMTPPSRTVDGR